MTAARTAQTGLVQGEIIPLNSGMDISASLTPANTSLPPSIESAGSPAAFSALLVAVGRDKDREAFARLFGHFAPRIKSFLMKGGAAPDQAEELAQETMFIIWQKAAAFDPQKANAATWIYTIARNKRTDALRKRIRPETGEDETDLIIDERDNAAQTLAGRQESDIMAREIEKLPSEQAELLYKSFFEDKSHADIAKESNLPLGTVKSRIRLALEKLGANRKIKELR